MRYLKIFEEFSEVEQLVAAMFEDVGVSPDRVNLPSDELMYVYSYDENVDFDTKRFDQMFSDIGCGLHFGYSGGFELVRYCIVYKKKIMDTILNYQTLDEAVYVIQSEVGQNAGDNAGIFFDTKFDDDLDGDGIWEIRSRRLDLLLEYIVYEIHCMRNDL
jgi:hypothetical protein